MLTQPLILILYGQILHSIEHPYAIGLVQILRHNHKLVGNAHLHLHGHATVEKNLVCIVQECVMLELELVDRASDAVGQPQKVPEGLYLIFWYVIQVNFQVPLLDQAFSLKLLVDKVPSVGLANFASFLHQLTHCQV